MSLNNLQIGIMPRTRPAPNSIYAEEYSSLYLCNKLRIKMLKKYLLILKANTACANCISYVLHYWFQYEAVF